LQEAKAGLLRKGFLGFAGNDIAIEHRGLRDSDIRLDAFVDIHDGTVFLYRYLG
jgi:hypothetical protein